MEESSSVKILSRKRKKAPPSSSDSKGVLTRSKSRMYCHQNRSGVFRSDPAPRDVFCFLPESESVKTFPDVIRFNASRVSSIKDLRMQRVFTPKVNSVHVKEEEGNDEGMELLGSSSDAAPDPSPVTNLEVGDAKGDELDRSGGMQLEENDERDASKNGLDIKDCAGNSPVSESKTALNKLVRRRVFKMSSSFSYRRMLPYLTDILNDDSGVSKIEIADAGLPPKLQKLDGVESNICSVAENSCAGDVKHFVVSFDNASPSENGNAQKLTEKVPNLSGADNELPKPEEIVRRVEVDRRCNENGVNTSDPTAEEECGQMTPPELDIITNTKFGCCGCSVEANNMKAENQDFKGLSIGSEKSSTNSTNRSVLNPCSQLRLFKNPGSLSYRRLLPFLMDLSKSNASASRIIQSPVAPVDLKQELRPASSATAEQSQENLNEKQHTEYGMQSSLSSMVPLQPSDDSSLDCTARLSQLMPNCSSNVEPSSITSETLCDTCGLNDLKMDEVTKSRINPRKLEPDFDRESNSLVQPSPSTEDDGVSNKKSTSEEARTVEKQMIGLEFQNNNDDLVYKTSLNQVSCQSATSGGLIAPTNGPSKGILKRNRLGCRGLCNCLSCSSFRLNADRAFEFSRNQMHDAEEVASELMKELANLRSLLEKFISTDNIHTASQLNPAQIKGACNRAMEAEKLAKERLSQLNYDLSVHCRIPVLLQPRVIFANYIQERTIPVLDPSITEKEG